MSNPSALEEIDRAVDRTILDTTRAARLKAALHQQYDMTQPEKPGGASRYYEYSDDLEEFWDNVPV